MLTQILQFKNDFLTNSRGFSNAEEFIVELEEFQNSKNFNFSNETYWSNYTHAALSSCLMQNVGYDLTHWNEYVSKTSKIVSNLLGINNISQEGKILELFVLHNINYVFDFEKNDLGIRALVANNDRSPNYLTDDTNNPYLLTASENSKIIGNIKTVMKIRGHKKKEIWGDNDIIVILNKNGVKQQYCIISCKTSLRERVYQSVFWSLHSRLQGVGRHVFVTADKGASGKSEIGHRGNDNVAHKSRDVLESTMDRVYVLRNSNEVNRSQVIKDFSYLEKDLLNWAQDIAGQ